MTDKEMAEEYADKILSNSKYPFIFNKEKVRAYIIKVYLDSLKYCKEAYNKGFAVCWKENAELKAQIEQMKCCSNEQEKCELLGIIQGKDKVIQELKKENQDLKQKTLVLHEGIFFDKPDVNRRVNIMDIICDVCKVVCLILLTLYSVIGIICIIAKLIK